MQKFAFLIIGFIVGLGGYASASNIHRNTGYITASASGLIDRDGKVIAGQNFTVVHAQLGEYVLTFDPGYFGRIGCAALVVQGTHHAILSRVEPDCSSSAVTFRIHLYDPSGLTDRSFGFVAVAMQPVYLR